MRLSYFFTLTSIFLFIFSTSVSAQVNIEKYRKEKKDRGFSGYVELDTSYKTGNVELTEVDIESRGDYRWNKMNTFLIVQNEYGFQGGKRYSNEGLAHLRNVFRSNSKIQTEIFAQIDYNKARLLEYRELFGGGLRYDCYRKKLWLGTAFMVEHERYDLKANDSHEKNITVARISTYITTNIAFSEHVHCALTTYMQPQIDDFGDLRILNDTALKVDLGKSLAFVMNFNLRYDSKPPEGIKKLDTELEPGLVFVF